MAKRYNKLPTDLMNLSHEDLQICYLCMEVGVKEEKRRKDKAIREANRYGGRKKF
jgi:hypothetical protein